MPFDDWHTLLPATTPRPSPVTAGMSVHAYYDLSMYTRTPEWREYNAAETDEERLAALRRMPDATVFFFEAPNDFDLFDVEDDVESAALG